jgi:alkylation response protein AidB-like acyl-CoA dehydrogenase
LNDGNTRLLLRRGCEFWWLSGVQSIFGGTTEIQQEIIARSLGL